MAKEYPIVDNVESFEAALARVRAAQKVYATYTQEQVDKIFKAAALAANNMRIPLAKMAVEETGMGVVEDKVIKNHYAAEYIYNAYKDTQTVGVLERDEAFGMMKVAEPIGVVAAVIPTTNPTSTAIFKTLACLKTAVGLITSCAETFVGMFPKGLSYRNWVFVFTGISFLLANVGLTAIITYAVPVLMFLYPLAITLILLALLGHFFDHDRAVYVWVTGLTLVAAFYDLLRTLPDHLRAVLHVNGLVDTVGKALPFATIGLGWICPAILGLVIGLIFRAVRPKKA